MDNHNINVTQSIGEFKEDGAVICVQVVYLGELICIPAREDIQLHRAELAKIKTYNRWIDKFYMHEEVKFFPWLCLYPKHGMAAKTIVKNVASGVIGKVIDLTNNFLILESSFLLRKSIDFFESRGV